MSSSIPRLPDVTAKDLRAVVRLMGDLSTVPNLDILGQELVSEAKNILPADFMLWNLWTLNMDRILECHGNHEHLTQVLDQRSDQLNATIHHHPVITSGHFDEGYLRPQRMSDYQSYAQFKSNPLFQEVYRHVDSHFQIGFGAAKLRDSHIILSWNLRSRDFTDREVQLLHLLGLQIGKLCPRIEERQQLQAAWTSVAAGLETITGANIASISGEPSLSAKEGCLLAALVRGESRTAAAKSLAWRRDTLDRNLGRLRERLGFENTAQLLQALAELKPSSKVRP